jgi:hypothetical protein
VLIFFVATNLHAADPSLDVKTAIERGLRRIEQGCGNYIKNRQCFSCHHNAVSIHSLTEARKLGFDIDKAKIAQQVDFTHESFKSRLESMQKGEGIGGASTTVAYGLVALKMGEHPADETTAGMITFLLKKQEKDGSWKTSANRPPTEASAFTTTGQTLRALKAYEASACEEQREQLKEAVRRGLDWLRKNKPQATEEKVFQLLGFLAASVDKNEIEAAKESLLKDQREDGGWAQLDTMESDAYATGTVLATLYQADLSFRDPRYQKGVQYLLRTQREDGAWIVQTRSRPVQTFFDNGDPGGKSQFISFAATNWAIIALLPAMESKP